MKATLQLLLSFLLMSSFAFSESKKCEVCVDVLTAYAESQPKEVLSDNQKTIESFKEYCSGLKEKRREFCDHVGGGEVSSSSILRQVLPPLGYNKPPEKICEELGKTSDVCEIKYEVIVDLTKENVEKLKVKQLKAILRRWGETCEGCLEKKDYVDLIKRLKPKYVKEEL